jgi:hypothetical protein
MAAIALALVEEEPEFGWGGGRRAGSVNKQLAETKNSQTLYKRRKREKDRRRPRSIMDLMAVPMPTDKPQSD